MAKVLSLVLFLVFVLVALLDSAEGKRDVPSEDKYDQKEFLSSDEYFQEELIKKSFRWGKGCRKRQTHRCPRCGGRHGGSAKTPVFGPPGRFDHGSGGGIYPAIAEGGMPRPERKISPPGPEAPDPAPQERLKPEPEEGSEPKFGADEGYFYKVGPEEGSEPKDEGYYYNVEPIEGNELTPEVEYKYYKPRPGKKAAYERNVATLEGFP